MLLFLPMLRKSATARAAGKSPLWERRAPVSGPFRRRLSFLFLIAAFAASFAFWPLEPGLAAILMDTGGQQTSVGAVPPATSQEDGGVHLRTPDRSTQNQNQNQDVQDLPWGIVPEVHYVWPPQPPGGRPPQWGGNQVQRPPHPGVRPPNWSEDSGGRPPQWNDRPSQRPPQQGGRPPQWNDGPGQRPPQQGGRPQPGGRPPQWNDGPGPGSRPPREGGRPPQWNEGAGQRPPQQGGRPPRGENLTGRPGGDSPRPGGGAPSPATRPPIGGISGAR